MYKKIGRKRSVRTENLINRVREKIRRNCQRSARKLAQEHNISRTTMQRLLKDDLRMTAFKKKRGHGLTVAQKQARLARCKKLLRRHAKSNIVFSDEKLFLLQPSLISQNDRMYAVWYCQHQLSTFLKTFWPFSDFKMFQGSWLGAPFRPAKNFRSFSLKKAFKSIDLFTDRKYCLIICCHSRDDYFTMNRGCFRKMERRQSRHRAKLVLLKFARFYRQRLMAAIVAWLESIGSFCLGIHAIEAQGSKDHTNHHDGRIQKENSTNLEGNSHENGACRVWVVSGAFTACNRSKRRSNQSQTVNRKLCNQY